MDYVYVVCFLLSTSVNLSCACGGVTSFHLLLPGRVSLKCPMLHLGLGTVRDQKEEDTEKKETAEDMRSFRKSFKFSLCICHTKHVF